MFGYPRDRGECLREVLGNVLGNGSDIYVKGWRFQSLLEKILGKNEIPPGKSSMQ